MNNALLKIRFRLLATFGMFPSAESYERKERQREEEFNRLQEIEKSDKLARFQELKQYIHSDAFNQKKKEINALRYKGSEPHQKEQRHHTLTRTEPIKTWLRVKDSEELAHYQKMEQSDELRQYRELKDFFESGEFGEFKNSLKEQQKAKEKQYKDTLATYKKLKKKYGGSARGKAQQDSEGLRKFQELEQTVQSDEFQRMPEEIKKLEFKNTDEYSRYQEYKKLSKRSDIQKALRFQNSKKHDLHQKALKSELLEEYQQLSDYLQSDEYKQAREYLKSKNKFRQSQEYQLLKEYEQLKDSEDMQWYFKNQHSSKFDFYRKWEKSFFDDFKGNALDTDKWLTTYYWGKALLNDSYVQATDHHFFTDGNNILVENGVLKITTRKEQVEGKAWHPNFGFYPKQFSYTSGIINTGQSFRQKYGIFRAKVKMDHAPSLRHSFWLVPDKILPEIDVFSYYRKSPRKIDLKAYSGNVKDKGSLRERKSVLRGINFSKKYCIYEIDWNQQGIQWKINGLTVRKQHHDIPDQSMYMILNSGVDGEIREKDLPKEMCLDWVEAFREKSQA
jgi:beta-glucanase (GH16 family)